MKAKTNLTMLCDFYQLTMANGYFKNGMKDQICYFDMFYRSVPDKGGFAIAAGLAQVIDYIQTLTFDDEDIEYLRSKNLFDEEFLDYLRNFKFTGDIWAVPEGTPVFPNEPILTVRAPAIQAQFVETFILLTINHQSLIATKSNRIVRLPSRSGCRRRSAGCPRQLHRRLCCYRLYHGRSEVRISRHRHHGSLLGADVPRRVLRLQDLLRDLPQQRHPAGGYL